MTKRQRVAVIEPWTDEEKQKIAGLFIKILPGAKLAPAESGGMECTASLPRGGGGVTVQAIKETTRNAGAVLYSCDVDLSNRTIRLWFGRGASTAVATGEECVFEPPRSLASGMTEDEIRIQRITDYSKTYRGTLTPAEVDVKVCDEKLQPLTATGTDRELYRLRVTGWREATLEQLDAFRLMFPCHISEVQITGEQCEFILTLRGRLSPAKPLFRRMLDKYGLS